TIAVQAGGVDVLYPRETAALAADMPAAGGLRLSEQPMGLAPQARHFPLRNRLISGLAQAVVVIEAAGRSGSLITADAALEQGCEVLAVPGHPFDARAGGCNRLIRDGARLVRGAEDVLEALGAMPVQRSLPLEPPAQPARVQSQRSVDAAKDLRRVAALHREILDRLGPSPIAEDQLIRDLGRGASEVTSVLTELEIDGAVCRQPGGLLSRA
ncbi:DNA-processing protein DprA, partial [Litorisediminicola beolgyonensis]